MKIKLFHGRKALLVAVVLFYIRYLLYAQKHYFYGGVFDAVTRTIVDSVKVTLLSEDGTAIDSMTTNKNIKVGYNNSTWFFFCDKKVPKRKMLFSAKGYEEQEVEVPAISFKWRETMRQMPNVYLQRLSKARTLGEATIRATKIKFYHKGDTLVFNADAFEVGEGSMLDALIRQLPGVELKRGGEIFVNGRRVEDLLLNGQKFFGEDRTLMLDNLPAYTVSRVKVLEKSTDLSRRMGKEAEKKIFTMDIQLKKAYSIGWFGHLLGGMGTKHRSVARLFALRFTPYSRLSVYGNMNNLSNEQKPGENEDWTPDDLSDHQITTRQAGFDYLFTHPEERYKVYGNTQVVSQKNILEQQETGISFVTDGNLWKYRTQEEQSRLFAFSTSNTWEFHPWKQTWTWLRVNGTYQSRKKQGEEILGLFTQSPTSYTNMADSLRLLSLRSPLKTFLLHRLLSEDLTESASFSGDVSVNLQKRVWSNDMILAGASLYYHREKGKNFKNRHLVYPNTPTSNSEFSRLYGKSDPTSSFSAQGTTTYMAWLTSTLLLTADYSIKYARIHRDYRLYQLERLAGWGENFLQPLGTLPSEVEYLRHIDRQNSFNMYLRSMSHNPALNLKYETSKWFFLLKLPLDRRAVTLDYCRASFNGTVRKHYLFFLPQLEIRKHWNEERSFVEFKYNHNAQEPASTNLVEEENTLDPLNIFRGNSQLKPAHTHNIEAKLFLKSDNHDAAYTLASSLTLEKKAFGYESVYNHITGITTYTPKNIDGNSNWDMTFTHSRFLDKEQILNLEFTSYLMLNRGVDFLGKTGGMTNRSVVHTLWSTGEFELGYNRNNISFTLLGGGGFNRATSKRSSFTTISVGEFHYGFSFKSPRLWGFQLSTDLKMYSRRGYENPQANTNELIWNARLHRSIGEKWSIELEGFDILHRLSNTTQTINSQGHFEIFKNVIPAYFMLKCRYQFTKK